MAIAENASVIVCLAHDPVSVTSITWNSNSLTKIAEATNGSNIQVSIWALHNCSSGTGSVDVTFASAIDAKTMTVTQLIGDTGVSNGGELNHDQSSTGTGSDTSPSAGTTAALTYGSEYAVGAIGWEETFTGGGSSTFTFSGQQEVTTGGAGDSNISLAEYFFQQDTTTSAVTFTNTGSSPTADWADVVVTFYRVGDHVRDVQEFRSFYWQQDRVQVAQEFRSSYYSKDRAQVAQQFRTWWYREEVSGDSFVAII